MTLRIGKPNRRHTVGLFLRSSLAVLATAGPAQAETFFLGSRLCEDGSAVRMVIGRDRIIVDRKSKTNIPSSVKSFDLWNFRAAEDAEASLCPEDRR